ncbi:MAG: hypothetical protein HUJ98_15405, partial [Bacteroidaceae bacterium]|nr:hypothetical protein [Bacteroidaceae bacterium]
MKYIIMTAIAAMGLMSCGSTKQAVLLPLEQAVKTLYNPQSERYDEEGFIAYAQKLLASGADNATKARAAT